MPRHGTLEMDYYNQIGENMNIDSVLKEHLLGVGGQRWGCCPMSYDYGLQGDDDDWIIYEWLDETVTAGVAWDMNKYVAQYVVALHNTVWGYK